MLDELLTTAELAKYLKIDVRTVYRYLKDGHLPAYRVGGQWRINREELDRWVRQKHSGALAPSLPPRVLVVDDDAPLRETLIELLSTFGYTAEGAEDGKAALALLRKVSFDCLIVDLKMPGMGGLELIRQAKSLGLHTPIIVLTAYASKESAIEAANLHVFRYLEKPLADMTELVQAVNAAIKKAE